MLNSILKINIFSFLSSYLNNLNNIFNINICNEDELLHFFVKSQSLHNLEKFKKLYDSFVKFRLKYIDYIDNIINTNIVGQHQAKLSIKQIICRWLYLILNDNNNNNDNDNINLNNLIIGYNKNLITKNNQLLLNIFSLCIVDFIKYDLIHFHIELNNVNINNNIIEITMEKIINYIVPTNNSSQIYFVDNIDIYSSNEVFTSNDFKLQHLLNLMNTITANNNIIIFGYNSLTDIDHTIYERFFEITLTKYTTMEKIEICNKRIIPSISNTTIISNEILSSIINNYEPEGGINKLKKRLFTVYDNFNIKKLKSTHPLKETIKLPDIKDYLIDYPINNIVKPNDIDSIGIINGLIVSNHIGEIFKIQCSYTIEKDNIITGNLKEIIIESISVAKTVAYNTLPSVQKTRISQKLKYNSLHIHCPDISTEKDGPSAGVGITCAIYSFHCLDWLSVHRIFNHNLDVFVYENAPSWSAEQDFFVAWEDISKS